MNAVFAIITVTKIDHNPISEKLSFLRMRKEIIPVTNEDAKITNGRTDKLGNNDKSALYNAEKIIQGKKMFITNLLKASTKSAVKKLILLRKYPTAIIKIIDKIVIRIAFIKKRFVN